MSKKLNKIISQNSEFDEIFSVYANGENLVEILNPKFIKLLLNLKNRLNFPLKISLINGRICIFLETSEEIFKPNIDNSVLKANSAFVLKRVLLYFLVVTKTLNLNAKI